MFSDSYKSFFESVLFHSLGYQIEVQSFKMISGGCINNALKMVTSEGLFFLKWNESCEPDMFEKEEAGLQLIINSNSISAPRVIGTGKVDGKFYILMEFVESTIQKGGFWYSFGRQLATMHRHSNSSFGLDNDNYIGKLPQKNALLDNWIDFFVENRLETQLGLGIYNGYISKDFAKKFRLLYPQLPGLLTDDPPSLLHGDLWSGNFMVGSKGQPVILDPAVYYGNREIELAFTKLFGGFDPGFYQSYHEEYPLEPGFTDRVDIYNLYPLLVHVNLFGTSYLSGVEKVIRRYC